MYIFIPTLSRLFKKTTLIDLDPSQAKIIKGKLVLPNCNILEKDIFTYQDDPFDCIVAADVLEHFQDLNPIISCIKKFFTKGTVLITSLPCENFYYQFARILFNEKKPADHYHSASQVEQRLKANGFISLSSGKLPFRGLPLFSINTWKLNE